MDLLLPGPIVWMILKVHHFWNFYLRHYTIRARCRLRMRINSEWILVSIGSLILIGVKCFLVVLRIWFLLGWFLLILFLCPFIMISMGVIHVHNEKFPCWIFFGATLSVHPIPCNLIHRVFNMPIFKVFNTLHITFSGVPSSTIKTSTGRHMFKI